MAKLQPESGYSPFDHPKVVSAAIEALSRADAMGLLPGRFVRLDDAVMRGLERGLAEAGIGRGLALQLHGANADPERLSALLRKISAALYESPVPHREWRSVERVLGLESTAELVGISLSSARRYFAGTRTTPDEVAARLHFLASWWVILPARTTMSESGVGSTVPASFSTDIRRPSCWAPIGTRTTMGRGRCGHWPRLSGPRPRHDRLPSRRSPLPLPSRRFISTRWKMEHDGPVDPLLFGYA